MLYEIEVKAKNEEEAEKIALNKPTMNGMMNDLKMVML